VCLCLCVYLCPCIAQQSALSHKSTVNTVIVIDCTHLSPLADYNFMTEIFHITQRGLHVGLMAAERTFGNDLRYALNL